VFFNATYIPSETGRRMGFLDGEERERVRRGWDGGEDGLEVARRYLRALPDHLQPGGRGLLGINRFYVDRGEIEREIRAAGLTLAEVVRMPLNPSAAYVVRPAGAADELPARRQQVRAGQGRSRPG